MGAIKVQSLDNKIYISGSIMTKQCYKFLNVMQYNNKNKVGNGVQIISGDEVQSLSNIVYKLRCQSIDFS